MVAFSSQSRTNGKARRQCLTPDMVVLALKKTLKNTLTGVRPWCLPLRHSPGYTWRRQTQGDEKSAFLTRDVFSSGNGLQHKHACFTQITLPFCPEPVRSHLALQTKEARRKGLPFECRYSTDCEKKQSEQSSVQVLSASTHSALLVPFTLTPQSPQQFFGKPGYNTTRTVKYTILI